MKYRIIKEEVRKGIFVFKIQEYKTVFLGDNKWETLDKDDVGYDGDFSEMEYGTEKDAYDEIEGIRIRLQGIEIIKEITF